MSSEVTDGEKIQEKDEESSPKEEVAEASKDGDETAVAQDSNNEDGNGNELTREETSKNSEKSYESKARAQMLAELERLRKEMTTAASTIERPKMKPYSPDIFNSLSPYYNKYMIDYVIKDQEPYYESWGSYGQRETALDIVEPEISLKMDNFPLPAIASKVPGQLYRIKLWSKNLSGKEGDIGSTRLPPIPPLAVQKLHNPEYQHFAMTYDAVPKFRQDVKKMYSTIEQKRKKADYERVQKDWKRMNLDELKELPEKSRFHYGKAISTYLGTSKGSSKAVHTLGQSLNVSPDEA